MLSKFQTEEKLNTFISNSSLTKGVIDLFAIFALFSLGFLEHTIILWSLVGQFLLLYF